MGRPVSPSVASMLAQALPPADWLRRARIRPGNLEVHWPEGNVLLAGDRLDPDSLEPDYNAEVTDEALS